MVKKIYAIEGMIEQSVIVPMGGGTVRVEFTGGRISSNGILPATYKTGNPLVQSAIENSDKFKNGTIKLLRVIGEEEKIVVVKEDENVFEDVKNSQEAKAILMEQFGVALSELGNKAAILEKAKELKVVFPNWN